MNELERVAQALKRAHAAGDEAAARKLAAYYRTLQQAAGGRVLGDMSRAELEALDPRSAEYGGVQSMPIGPGEALAGASPFLPALGRMALKGAGTALKGAIMGGAGGSAWYGAKKALEGAE